MKPSLEKIREAVRSRLCLGRQCSEAACRDRMKGKHFTGGGRIWLATDASEREVARIETLEEHNNRNRYHETKNALPN